HLEISHNDIGDEVIEALAYTCHKLEHLELDGCSFRLSSKSEQVLIQEMTSSIEEDEKQLKGASHMIEISAKFADDPEERDNSITNSEEASEVQMKLLISVEDYEDVYFDNDPISQSVKETNEDVISQSDRVDDD
ncbi:12567_t:CDS:2, partial [Funneliformis geosporum]